MGKGCRFRHTISTYDSLIAAMVVLHVRATSAETLDYCNQSIKRVNIGKFMKQSLFLQRVKSSSTLGVAVEL
jgi:hypothetical protein